MTIGFKHYSATIVTRIAVMTAWLTPVAEGCREALLTVNEVLRRSQRS